ncbi:methylaspartate ammonia-lyase [soil metagenome]
MARIAALHCVANEGGFFVDDQAAIRAGADHDGFLYLGEPLTPGFVAIRQPAAAVSVLLVLDDGQVAIGDCITVQYAGVGGRDPLLTVSDTVAVVEQHIGPALIGRSLDSFRELAEQIEELSPGGEPLSAAVRYGVSQALLDAVARSQQRTMAEVVRDEYATGSALVPVPVFAQSGDDRYQAVDKMVLKGIDALPHGLINNVAEKLGRNGELLAEYVSWLRDRILAVRTDPSYQPRLHIDTYGTVGLALGTDVDVVADYLASLGALAAPFSLRIEHPVDTGSRDSQIAYYTDLRAALEQRSPRVELVVDEWCNTIEDIRLFCAAGAADVIHVKTPDLGGIGNTIESLLLVREAGLAAYCGGSCNDTDISARVCAQVAMACVADQVLARPGMGLDEGVMIVRNEMRRTAALARASASVKSSPAGATLAPLAASV